MKKYLYIKKSSPQCFSYERTGCTCIGRKYRESLVAKKGTKWKLPTGQQVGFYLPGSILNESSEKSVLIKKR